jgi:superfamily II DNA or RNA helicase
MQRFSSRRQRLDRSFITGRLKGALAYDRIAGYFSSSLLEVIGEELESVSGLIRVVCNSDLHPLDVQTARAAKLAVWRSWTGAQPETLLEGSSESKARSRFQRLYQLLVSEKLLVRVLPDEAFGMVHGKAGVITLADGLKTCFLGSANESKSGWQMNYELVWEDPSLEAVDWVQEEFDILWTSPMATPLSEAVIQDIERLSRRRVLHTIGDWQPEPEKTPDPASAMIETPVYRQDAGLWEHQKYFVKIAFDAHRGLYGKARFVLADQVGLGKTLQLAMAAQLMALTGDKPILVICPKTLIKQWQTEMKDFLDMPSAIWDGRRWVDENEIAYPVFGAEGIRKCPRRVGIVSSGLIKRGSEASRVLLQIKYDCVILDEAHHARRSNLGINRDRETADPNNLLRFMYQLAEQTRSLMMATATPVQLRPVEAWDLLDILSRGDDTVIGNPHSRWRNAEEALNLVMGRDSIPSGEAERWEWARNPFPPIGEHLDFQVLRRRLEATEDEAVIPGDRYLKLTTPDRSRLNRIFPSLVRDHNPFIQRIIRRTRQQLEHEIDPESGEPLLKPISVELFGEDEADAVRMPPYMRDAYQRAEEFCEALKERLAGSGFLKTLLLRRVGSSIAAGLSTAQKMLDDWEEVEAIADEEDSNEEQNVPVSHETATAPTPAPKELAITRTLTGTERVLLKRFIDSLEANKERDPKYAVVLQCLRQRGWLETGCIIFSQYRDSIQWLADQLTQDFPEEPIALYSGASTSGLMLGGQWTQMQRDPIKGMVRQGQIRLLLGTDAASEGLNLQRLATLINLDLPWNPTRLEQRKGRIQRIGQIHDSVKIYNLRYKDSVEDRVHELLSSRLHDIYAMFGQIPDVLEDAWVAMAVGEKEEAKRIIDALPQQHPFELRYTKKVEKVDWETCAEVLSSEAKKQVLSTSWY